MKLVMKFKALMLAFMSIFPGCAKKEHVFLKGDAGVHSANCSIWRDCNPAPDAHPERVNHGTLWQQAIPYVSNTNAGGIVGDTNMLRVIQLNYWDEPVRR